MLVYRNMTTSNGFSCVIKEMCKIMVIIRAYTLATGGMRLDRKSQRTYTNIELRKENEMVPGGQVIKVRLSLTKELELLTGEDYS